MALGWPGRLIIKHWPRITATWRERMAVGTKFRLIWRICSPKPGIVLLATANVASGVTSLIAGPVPPVVKIKWQPALSTKSISVFSISVCSSAIKRVSNCMGVITARLSQSCKLGIPLSSYTPVDARSEIDTKPILMNSFVIRLSV